MLGRYRLECELGAGAMGVVHAAFDPDLERRIALKVLRDTAATPEAKDRLMREARAMARLTHPNVVTVHEVGTIGGRDFVAMELILGETLAEWLRSNKRPTTAIIDAFLAAGRGLAAAHAAGIVHRDFKPHNVLRGRDGRIVVTDFGLAREAEHGIPAELETTLPVGVSTTPPTSLAKFTVTGALLGTPAYMAPEQWTGGKITPATDQFAYCIALWEALAGERPYRGSSREELRKQVARGPAALDVSRIPRRLRSLLRRGLDPDPARRWPSMNAVLVQLVRAKRRPRIALAGGALIAAAGVFVALDPNDAPAPACESPARDVSTVWSPAIAAEMRAETSEAHVAVLETAHRAWRATRANACSAPPQVKQAQLQCLDGVLSRFAALRQAYVHVPSASAQCLQGQLIDPEICRKPAVVDVPRLTLLPTPDVIAAYELYGRSDTEHPPSDAELAALSSKPSADPCARVIATLAFDIASKDVPRARSLMNDAVSTVDQCGDERLRADLLIQAAPYQRERPMIGPKGESAIRQAETAAQRVMQPDIEAALASQRIDIAQQNKHWDEAFRLVEIEIAGYGARGLQLQQLRGVITRNRLRLQRADPDDLVAVTTDSATWRPLATASHKLDFSTLLDAQAASARLWLGDVPTAHAELLRVWQALPRTERTGKTREIHGEVVDVHGRPVAGASVAAARQLGADSVGIGVPLSGFEDSLRFTTTDNNGHFVISDFSDAPRAGAIAAQFADRRSRPAPIATHVRLVVEPTRSLSGTVEFGGTPHTRVAVRCEAADDPIGWFPNIAPVAADGSFIIAGAPVGAVRISAWVRDDGHIKYQTYPASPAPITNLRLAIPSSTRIVDVFVRSTFDIPLNNAQIILLTGKQQIRNTGDLLRVQKTAAVQSSFAKPIIGKNVPKAMANKIRAGDLVAHFENASLDDLTVCAIDIPGDLSDPEYLRRLRAHILQLTLQCEQIGPDTTVVVVTVPPQQRLD